MPSRYARPSRPERRPGSMRSGHCECGAGPGRRPGFLQAGGRGARQRHRLARCLPGQQRRQSQARGYTGYWSRPAHRRSVPVSDHVAAFEGLLAAGVSASWRPTQWKKKKSPRKHPAAQPKSAQFLTRILNYSYSYSCAATPASERLLGRPAKVCKYLTHVRGRPDCRPCQYAWPDIGYGRGCTRGC